MCTSSARLLALVTVAESLDETGRKNTMTIERQEDDCDKSDMRSLCYVHFPPQSPLCVMCGCVREGAGGRGPYAPIMTFKSVEDEEETTMKEVRRGVGDLSSWQTDGVLFFFCSRCRRPDFIYDMFINDDDDDDAHVDDGGVRGVMGWTWEISWMVVAFGARAIWLTLGDHFIRSMMRANATWWAGGEL